MTERTETSVGPNGRTTEQELVAWRDRTRVFLRPVAAPSILGLLAWACAAFVVAADMAWGYGAADSMTALGPFVMFMGLAQLFAAMWAYNARDGFATGFHGIWGATWLAYGALFTFVLEGQNAVAIGSAAAGGDLGQFPEFGYWFVAVGAASLVLGIAAFADSTAMALTVLTLGVASVLLFLEAVLGGSAWGTVAGWTFLGAVVLAVYTAAALTYQHAFGSEKIPVGARKGRERYSELDDRITVPVEYAIGEPGVRRGE